MEYVAWLMETAGSFMAIPHIWDRPRAQTRYRVEAARLLAFIGSRETIPFLADLFNRDPEAPVRAAAVEAIGIIGVDPEGIALRAFQEALLPPNSLRDEAVLVAIARATGALCRFSGPPLSNAGTRLLTMLAGFDHRPLASRQAQLEIRSLR
jgi:outer membrane protein assembly factor BamB